jgi:hypothetical protein
MRRQNQPIAAVRNTINKIVNNIVHNIMASYTLFFDCSRQSSSALTGWQRQPEYSSPEQKAGKARSNAVPARSGASRASNQPSATTTTTKRQLRRRHAPVRIKTQ